MKAGQTIILKCGCKHPFQDTKYGVGNRVHNVGGSKGSPNKVSCTVCGKTDSHSFGGK